MKVKISVTANFKSKAKPLLKKYPSLAAELMRLEEELLNNPRFGTPLGNDSFKIRLSIKSKGKGKSGGARVITHLESEILGSFEKTTEGEINIYLLSIYDKSETATISVKELKELIRNRT